MPVFGSGKERLTARLSIFSLSVYLSMQEPFRQQIVLHNTLVTYYEGDKGQGDALPVVFLHGWRSQGRVWFPLWEEFFEQHTQQGSNLPYVFYAVDMPGFGSSEAPRKPYRLQDYALVVEEFCQRLGFAHVVLVGHSFGGRIAIKVASRGRVILKQLMLIGSAGFRPRGFLHSLKRVVAQIVKPFFAFSFMQPLRRKLYTVIGAHDYMATPKLTQTFVNILGEDLEHLLPQIAVPTLLVWGEHDRETPVSFGERMRDALPHATLVVIPRAGHFVFLDQPVAFVEHVLAFLH